MKIESVSPPANSKLVLIRRVIEDVKVGRFVGCISGVDRTVLGVVGNLEEY